jgi:hypothetical protein
MILVKEKSLRLPVDKQ